MENKLEILWRGAVIGSLENGTSDMWYLEGEWVSNLSEMAKEFEQIVSQFNFKEVFADHTKGTRGILLSNGHETHILIMGLSNGQLCLRRVFQKEAVKWLLENVKP